MKTLLKITILLNFMVGLRAQNSTQDAILGKWMNAEKDLAVEVYKQNGQYRAKVIWFVCENGTKMSDFNDKKNPDAALKNRPWLGLEVLNGLFYNGDNEWNKGYIYDPNTGHTFRSICRLENSHTLKVRGYWLYEWIGKNMTFNRMN